MLHSESEVEKQKGVGTQVGDYLPYSAGQCLYLPIQLFAYRIFTHCTQEKCIKLCALWHSDHYA